MAEPDRPQSPFAGMAELSARAPVRALSLVEIEQMLAEHRLYLETEYHQGHRANFSSADLAGRDFSGLNLRGIKIWTAPCSAGLTAWRWVSRCAPRRGRPPRCTAGWRIPRWNLAPWCRFARARICGWQGSTTRICRMPILMAPKA